MIGTLRGRLVIKRTDYIVVEACGVGYELSVPADALSALPETGLEVYLHVHTHVREDGIRLFGFISEEDKRLFMVLLGVNGVGPKLALAILSGSSGEDLMKAIEEEDVAFLSRIPGVGKKTAGRIILELKQKLPSPGAVRDPAFRDALSALSNLGYRAQESREALEKAVRKGYNDLQSLIKEALKELTGN